MQRQAHTWMTIDEQVAFAWKYREHFADVAAHNLSRVSRRDLPVRNAWIELADMPDARADAPTGFSQLDLFGDAA